MEKLESQNVLITGVNGFVGHHLVEELVGAGHKVYGASREPELSAELAGKVEHYWQVDLMQLGDTRRIDWSAINSVIHLAGLAAVGASFDDPDLYRRVNTGIITNLFEAASSRGVHPRIVSISTGAVYGRTDGPVTEESEINPGSPYAQSKLDAEELVSSYRQQGFPDAINVRPFNHIGPNQGKGFAIPDFGYQIVDPGAEEIRVGNLDSERDFTDVRDVVRAYRLLVEAPQLKYSVYNVCSGVSRRIGDLLELELKAAGRPDMPIVHDDSLGRPNDEDVIVGSRDRLTAETGWEPKIPIERTIQDFVDSIR